MARRRTGLNRQQTRLQPHSGGQSHGVTISLSDSGRSRTERVDIDSDLRVCSSYRHIQFHNHKVLSHSSSS